MEQFNLQAFLKNPNRPIVTRDGHAARIICTNRVDKTHSILALLFEDEEEIEKKFINILQKVNIIQTQSVHMIYALPQLKKEGWINVYRGYGGYNTFVCNRIFATKEEAQREKRDIIATLKIEWEE